MELLKAYRPLKLFWTDAATISTDVKRHVTAISMSLILTDNGHSIFPLHKLPFSRPSNEYVL